MNDIAKSIERLDGHIAHHMHEVRQLRKERSKLATSVETLFAQSGRRGVSLNCGLSVELHEKRSVRSKSKKDVCQAMDDMLYANGVPNSGDLAKQLANLKHKVVAVKTVSVKKHFQ